MQNGNVQNANPERLDTPDRTDDVKARGSVNGARG